MKTSYGKWLLKFNSEKINNLTNELFEIAKLFETIRVVPGRREEKLEDARKRVSEIKKEREQLQQEITDMIFIESFLK